MKEELISLLRRMEWDEITTQVLADKKVLRALLKLLYHEDDHIHWLAADAIGRYGAALAKDDPEKTRELVRRLLWNLNEECGASPWGSVEAIGAITAQRPDLFNNYVSILFPFHEDENLYPGVIWTQVQVGRTLPDVVAEYIPFLLASLKHPSATIRAYAAWALGEVKVCEATEALQQLLQDNAVASIYECGGQYRATTVAETVQTSIAILQNDC